MNHYIFGAKSIAYGACEAMKLLRPKDEILGFLVSSLKGNPRILTGLPVREIGEVARELSPPEKANVRVLVATPEDVHEAIVHILEKNGFSNYRLLDAKAEGELMSRYHRVLGVFPALRDLPLGSERAKLTVHAARFRGDKPLSRPPEFPAYVCPLILGRGGVEDERPGTAWEPHDDEGDNISEKNPNYCELTGLYWIWKNRLQGSDEYVGLCHYRRCLDVTEDDLARLKASDVDAVLPFPMLHAPDIREHHARYVKERDWETMLRALEEIHPKDMERYEEIFSKPYFYNYNMFIVKKRVLADYCAWLFPILERTEETSNPKGRERSDRYLAYMGESLCTLYFMNRQEDLKVYHAERRMFI